MRKLILIVGCLALLPGLLFLWLGVIGLRSGPEGWTMLGVSSRSNLILAMPVGTEFEVEGGRILLESVNPAPPESGNSDLLAMNRANWQVFGVTRSRLSFGERTFRQEFLVDRKEVQNLLREKYGFASEDEVTFSGSFLKGTSYQDLMQ